MAVDRVMAILLLLGHFRLGLTLPIPRTRELQDAFFPILCTCTSWLLSCIGAGKWRQLDNVPDIRGTSYIFNTVELGENQNQNQGSTWLPYGWTETLDLHGNQLETLQKDSFEGLVLLKKLNLSGNIISKIAGFTFQALPFLEILDLSGNKVTTLLDGAFKSWHGLSFLRQLNLNSNPLEVIENDAFDKLPSMQYLHLCGTKLSVQMMYPAFMAVPNIVQLDLPDRVRCCLCYVARTIEILFNTVKMDYSNPCANDTSCDVRETFLLIHGTVLSAQMSLKNNKILESFLNQNAGPSLMDSPSFPRENSLSRSSKLGLLQSREENEKNIYIGKHLDPHLVSLKAASMPHLSRIRQRPSSERDARYTPLLSKAKHLQGNISGRKRGSHRHRNIFGSVKVPLHQFSDVPRDSHRYGLPVEAVSKFNLQNNLKKHRVKKRVKRELESDQQANNNERVKPTTILIIPETTTEQPEIRYEFESIHSDVKELDISTPAEPKTKTTESADTPKVIELLPEVGNNVKAKHKPGVMTAPNPGHISHALQQVEMIDPGDNEAVTISEESWHNPLGQFLDNAVQKNVDVSFSPTPATQPSTKLSQVEIVRRFKEAYKKYIEGNYNQQQNEVTGSEQQTTSNLGIDTQEGNNDLFSPVHPKKIIKDSVKSSSSDNSKLKTNVNDMFEAKVNEEVRAVEPNKDIQTLFAHVIRIIKTDCLNPKLEAACTDLLSKIGHLMKQYEGKEYLPEVGSWNPSLLSPNVKEEGDGKETEIFPPPITRPEQKQKPHREHEGGKGKYIPNYAEIYTEEPKSLSSVKYGHKLLLGIAVTVVVMVIVAVVCLIEICSQRTESKAPFATGDAPCKKQSKSRLNKVTERITGKKSKDAPKQASLLEDGMELPKPLWLQDLYQPLDSVHKKSIGYGSYYKESSEEEGVFNIAHVSAPSDSRIP